MRHRGFHRKLIAILAADIVGYSRMMEVDEPGTLRAVRALRSELFDRLMAAYDGRLIKTMGDGFLVEFASAVDAVACAIALQQGITKRMLDVPATKRIALRIGINVGDIVADGADIFGDGVNMAARLEGLCEPGGICVSVIVREYLYGKLALVLVDSGERHVKNISRPVRVFSVPAADISGFPLASLEPPARRRFARATRKSIGPVGAACIFILLVTLVEFLVLHDNTSQDLSAPRLSLAVLPFNSADPSQSYFSDGLAGNLTTDLSVMIPELTVVAYSSARAAVSKSMESGSIGRELHVHYLLEGEVQRFDQDVKVFARLVDGGTSRQIWASRFESKQSSLLDLQDQITAQIANTLNVELVRAGARESERDNNPTAADLVMQGEARMSQNLSYAVLSDAEGYFRKAVNIDPNNLTALIDLGQLLALRVSTSTDKNAGPDNLLSEAKLLLDHALQLDPRRAGLHNALGLLAMADGKNEEAAAQFRAEISINRNAASSYTNLGNALTRLGLPEEALPMILKALELDPLNPNISIVYLQAMSVFFALGRYDDAIAMGEKARAANPNVPATLYMLASAYGLVGNTRLAQSALKDAEHAQPNMTIASFQSSVTPSNGQTKEFIERFCDGLRKAGLL